MVKKIEKVKQILEICVLYNIQGEFISKWWRWNMKKWFVFFIFFFVLELVYGNTGSILINHKYYRLKFENIKKIEKVDYLGKRKLNIEGEFKTILVKNRNIIISGFKNKKGIIKKLSLPKGVRFEMKNARRNLIFSSEEVKIFDENTPKNSVTIYKDGKIKIADDDETISIVPNKIVEDENGHLHLKGGSKKIIGLLYGILHNALDFNIENVSAHFLNDMLNDTHNSTPSQFNSNVSKKVNSGEILKREDGEKVEEYVYYNINKIIADVVIADIEIKNSSDNKTHLYIYKDNIPGKGYKVEIEEKDGTLKIKEYFKASQKRKKWFIFRLFSDVENEKEVNVEMVLEIPSKLNLINLKASSGNIVVNNIKSDKTLIETVSGNILFKNCEMPFMSLNTVSGDVYLSKIKRNKKLIVDTTSGDVKVENMEKCNKLSIDTVSGDIFVKDTNGVNLICDTTSGDFKFVKGKFGIISFDTTSGDVYINNGFISGKLLLDSTSGDMTILNSDIEFLSAESTSGTVNVTNSFINKKSISVEDYIEKRNRSKRKSKEEDVYNYIPKNNGGSSIFSLKHGVLKSMNLDDIYNYIGEVRVCY